jgi:hypothetical protein
MQMLTIERPSTRFGASRPVALCCGAWQCTVLAAARALVFGASLAAISFVAGVSLGFIDEPRLGNAFVIRGLLPFVFMSACSACFIGGAQQAGKGLACGLRRGDGGAGFCRPAEAVHAVYRHRVQRERRGLWRVFRHPGIPGLALCVVERDSVGALLVAELPQSTRP